MSAQRASSILLAVLALITTLAGCGGRSAPDVAAPRDGGGSPLDAADACVERCAPDACEAVRCDSPPPPTCSSATTLRTFEASGECVDGACDYAAADVPCEAGCLEGRCECAPAPWTSIILDGGGGSGASIAAEPSGRAHISYVDREGDVRYGVREPGGAWAMATVDVDSWMDWPTSLALDTSGVVHLAYQGSRTRPELRHAYRAPGDAWSTSSVEPIGGDGSVAVDGSGAVHLAYVFFSGWGLRYARRGEDGTWITSRLDADEVRRYPSLAVDASGAAYLAYADGESLRYGHRDLAGAWTTTTVDSLSSPHMSLAIDAWGGVHIAYEHQELTRVLRHAYRDPAGAWTITTIDAGEAGSIYVGHDASLAVDRLGGVHVSYTDRPGRNLRYAHRSPTGEWSTIVIDAESLATRGTSIAVDDSGGVHIGYHASDGLRYATARRCP